MVKGQVKTKQARRGFKHTGAQAERTAAMMIVARSVGPSLCFACLVVGCFMDLTGQASTIKARARTR